MDQSLLASTNKVLGSFGMDLKLTGRYGPHKLAILASYLLLSLLTVAWSFSASDPLSNPIGARVEAKSFESGEQWLLLTNESAQDWEDITLTLNDLYVFELSDPIAEAEVEQVFVKDFDYLLYLPRSRHHGTIEDISAEVPGPKAPADLQPAKLVLKTNQGSHSWDFRPPPKTAETKSKRED